MSRIKNKRQSMLEGAAVLFIATAVVKILGGIFKIPLGNFIGELGMGYFRTAYDLYLPVYSVALAGMPVAVCRLVAESVARERFRDTRRILSVARRSFFIVGVIACLILIAIAYPYLSLVLKQTNGLPGVLVIAPSIIFCCVVAAYRGYYQGLFNMNVTAVTEVIEAVGKLIIGLILAFAVGKAGAPPQYQAAAAIMGITVGTLFSAVYASIRYKRSGDGITAEQLRLSPPAKDSNATLKALMMIAVPMALGSLATQIAGMIDVMTVQSRLLTSVTENTEIFKTNYPEMWQALLADADAGGTDAGVIKLVPTYLYGCYKGFAFSVYNLIPSITSMLGVSAVPAMTTAWANRCKRDVRKNFEMVIRVSSLVALPSGFGICALAGGIMNLLYASKPIGASIAGPVLSIFGIAVIFCGISMPMTSLLQAIGKERVPVYNMIVGAILKIIVNYIFVAIPSVNVKGAAIGTVVCYAYILIADFYVLCKYTKIVPNLMTTIVKPLIASAMCGITAWAVSGIAGHFMSDKISTVLAILVACVVYVIAVLVLRVLSHDDIVSLPKGEKIAALLEKRRWI